MTPNEALTALINEYECDGLPMRLVKPIQVLQSALASRAELPAGLWRVGRSLGRTLYVGDQIVGLVDTPELASAIVDAMNRARAEVPADVADLTDDLRRWALAIRRSGQYMDPDSLDRAGWLLESLSARLANAEAKRDKAWIDAWLAAKEFKIPKSPEGATHLLLESQAFGRMREEARAKETRELRAKLAAAEAVVAQARNVSPIPCEEFVVKSETADLWIAEQKGSWARWGARSEAMSLPMSEWESRLSSDRRWLVFQPSVQPTPSAKGACDGFILADAADAVHGEETGLCTRCGLPPHEHSCSNGQKSPCPAPEPAQAGEDVLERPASNQPRGPGARCEDEGDLRKR
jgi:hypothetical protein